MEKKCGTCRRFAVRPTEMKLSRAAKPMSACGPGAYCHGGPVRGWCEKNKRMQESTSLEGCYEPGGPVTKVAGAQNRVRTFFRDNVASGPGLTLVVVGLLAGAGALAQRGS